MGSNERCKFCPAATVVLLPQQLALPVLMASAVSAECTLQQRSLVHRQP